LVGWMTYGDGLRYDTILCVYRAVKKLTCHTGQTEKLKKQRTKNKSRSMISPVRYGDREGSPG